MDSEMMNPFSNTNEWKRIALDAQRNVANSIKLLEKKEAELSAYRVLGTVEDFQRLVTAQNEPNKGYYYCPNCGCEVTPTFHEYCNTCGTAVVVVDESYTQAQANRAFELLKAQNEGRLVELPCKVGDTVYWYEPHCCICEDYIDNPEMCGERPQCGTRTITSIVFDYEMIPYVGETVFLTPEEAAEALAKEDTANDK